MSEWVETRIGVLPREWRVQPLAETTIKIQDGTHFSPKSEDGPYRYVTSKNIQFGRLDLSDCGWISQQEHDAIYARCDVKYGDVLLTKDGANTGNASLNDQHEPFSLLSSVAILRTDGVAHHAGFILQYLLSPLGQRRLKDLMSGNAITRLTLQKIKAFETPVPSAPEQRRIAEILSTLDETIEQTEALIAKCQQIKAGLMQDLFTRGVTPDGKLRPAPTEAPQLYKESRLGWIPKEWEVGPLTTFVDFFDSKRVPLKEEDRAQIPGQIPYYGASGVIDYIDRWLFDEELILLGEDGENVVSRNLPLVFKVSGKCWVNNHAHVLRPTVGHEIDYWTEYLEWRDYTPLTSGSAQPKITQNKLGRMLVSAPRQTEQKSISGRVESFSQRIAIEQAHLRKLRQQKLGLMHDLLTGRVRVKVAEAAAA